MHALHDMNGLNIMKYHSTATPVSHLPTVEKGIAEHYMQRAFSSYSVMVVMVMVMTVMTLMRVMVMMLDRCCKG